MNEETQFLDELKEDVAQDPFADIIVPTDPQSEKKDEDDPEEQPESVKDRRHRRLEEKLRIEREANIAMAARLETLAEASKSVETPEYLKSIERIYGTDSPEATAATELLKNALLSVKEEAKREALAETQAERLREKEQLQKEEATLDSMLDELEDAYDVDLTSQKAEATRKGFFKQLERMSPKDSEGNIIAYADHHAVWDAYKDKFVKKPDTRAKDLASRAMVQGGQSAPSTLQDDATVRFLKDNGII